MEFDTLSLAKQTAAVLAREPDLQRPEPNRLLLAQGFVHFALTPEENETVLITDDRRDCDGLLLLTIHDYGHANGTFIHHTTDDATRHATIALATQAAEVHGPGIRLAVLATSQSFLGENPWHCSTKVFTKLERTLRKFVSKGRLDIMAIDPDTIIPQNPSELFFHRYKDQDEWVYEIGVTNTDFHIRFTQQQAQKFCARPGSIRRIPDSWE